MGKKKIRKKRKSKKIKINYNRLILILAILVIVYFSLRSIPMLMVSNAKTVPVEGGTIEKTVECEGVVLRNETVYKAETQGTLKTYNKSGTKLSRGIKVAEIQNETSNNYDKELEKIDNEIEDLKKRLASQNEVLKEDIKKNQNEIDDIMIELQNSIASEDYDKAKETKDKLLVATNKKDSITNENKLLTNQIDDALKRKNELVQKIKNLRTTYYSDVSGILSYETDGLEDKFSAKNIQKYSLKNFKTLKQNQESIESDTDLKVGDAIFKIVEDQTWFIISKVDSSQIKGLEKHETIKVKLGGDVLKGTIYKIDSTKKDTLLIIEFKDYLYNHLNDRYVDLEIITNTYKGIVIPKSSVIEKEGKKGVYIKAISGVVEFREVKVLGGDEENVVIDEGEDGYISSEKNRDEIVKTVRVFDEVFENGKRGKEGYIVGF